MAGKRSDIFFIDFQFLQVQINSYGEQILRGFCIVPVECRLWIRQTTKQLTELHYSSNIIHMYALVEDKY